MKRKGVTLVETIMYISLASLLFSLMIGLIISLTSYRNQYINNAIEEDLVLNGIIAISSNLTKGQINSIDVENNKIIIRYGSSNKSSQIAKYNNSNLAISYYDGISLTTVNKIITDIEEFEAIKKNKLVYIKIKIKGNEYEEVFKI